MSMNNEPKENFFVVFNNDNQVESVKAGNIVLSACLFLLAIVILFSAFYTNNEKEVTVVTRFGKISSVTRSGFHTKIPFVDTKNKFNLDIQSKNVDASSATKDQQTVGITVNVQYKIDGAKIENLYKTIKDEETLHNSIVPPFVSEAVKATSSKYTSYEMLEKRDAFKIEIEKALSERLSEYNLVVVAVNIVNIDWSDNFEKAIEAKVIAEQNAQASKQRLEQAKIEADIEITKAKGEAEAQRILSENLAKNPLYLEFKKLEKWDGKLPTVTSDGSTIISLK